MKYEYILLISSLITAVGIIINAIKSVGKGSKKTVDKYIENQISPSLKEIKDVINNIHDEMQDMKKNLIMIKCKDFVMNVYALLAI